MNDKSSGEWSSEFGADVVVTYNDATKTLKFVYKLHDANFNIQLENIDAQRTHISGGTFGAMEK